MIDCDHLFYITAGSGIGMGHLRRSLAIAAGLKKPSKKIFFVVKGDKSAVKILKQNGFRAVLYSKLVLSLLRPKMVIIDQKDDVSREIGSFKSKGARVCLIDNISRARLRSDIAIYPLSHLKDGMNWQGFKGKKYIGARYFPLNKEFLRSRSIKHKVFTILVTMGGADPFGLTSRVTKALSSIGSRFRAYIVKGPAFKKQKIEEDKRFTIVNDPSSIAGLMSRSDIAITAFGTTLYELAYMGVPAVIINNYRQDAGDAGEFRKLGTSIPLGYYKDIDGRSIVKAVDSLMKNRKNLVKLSLRGRKLVDGKGTQRIVKLLKK